jgi:hypothetical protein
MNADGCSAEPCPPEEELRKLEIAAMVIFGVVALVAWFALVARPVCPEFDWLIARLMQVRECSGAEGRPVGGGLGWRGVKVLLARCLPVLCFDLLTACFPSAWCRVLCGSCPASCASGTRRC